MDTRGKILAAAIEIFGEHGVRSSSLRLVAERAGVGQTTIIHHFNSQQGLIAAVFEQGIEKLSTRVKWAADDSSGLPTTDQLRAQVRAIAGFCFQERATTRVWTEAPVTFFTQAILPEPAGMLGMPASVLEPYTKVLSGRQNEPIDLPKLDALAKNWFGQKAVEGLDSVIEDKNLSSTEALVLILLIYFSIFGTASLWSSMADQIPTMFELLGTRSSGSAPTST